MAIRNYNRKITRFSRGASESNIQDLRDHIDRVIEQDLLGRSSGGFGIEWEIRECDKGFILETSIGRGGKWVAKVFVIVLIPALVIGLFNSLRGENETLLHIVGMYSAYFVFYLLGLVQLASVHASAEQALVDEYSMSVI